MRPGDITRPKFSEAADFCREAARLVSTDRRPLNPDRLINFRTTAELWSAYIAAKQKAEPYMQLVFRPADVAAMMELFKIARRLGVPFNVDNYVDAAGYAGCAGELANASK